MDSKGKHFSNQDDSDSDQSMNVPLANLICNNDTSTISVQSNFSTDDDDLDKDPDFYPNCEVGNCQYPLYTACEGCNVFLCEFYEKYSCSDNHKDGLLPNQNNRNTNIETNKKQNKNPRNVEHNPHCEIGECRGAIYAGCNLCYRYLCWDHLDNSLCVNDHQMPKSNSSQNTVLETIENSCQGVTNNNIPESFHVDGSRKEGMSEELLIKKKRVNKKNMAKLLRDKGEEYISPKTSKNVPARRMLKERCNGQICAKFSHNCSEFSDEDRQKLLDDFYNTKSLQLQREYIVRYVSQRETKRKTSNRENSRRNLTNLYTLPKGNDKISVCKKMFMHTLSVSEKTIRTSLAKVTQTGVVEKEKRGGRLAHLKDADMILRLAISNHINRFPRMESHFCRSKSTREYLHSDINIKKMLIMFNEEHKEANIKSSYYTYWDEFQKLNLSFHHPKKDQCGLCCTYREGDESKKAELSEMYNSHIAEKVAVRQHKKEAQQLADAHTVCLCFDLQQVISLPKSFESQLFYHRRLSNYNFTIYNLANKQCDCYLWHECISSRGSSEIASCLYKQLIDLDDKGTKEVFLFSDGTCSQNKNSGIASMLLHVVTTLPNIFFISLKFFAPYHGQNEGDSAHSAINTAMTAAGDVFVPSQLIPIITLARNKKPYIVHYLESADFKDFKTMAKDLRVLSVRQDDNGGKVDWPSMVEFMVLKQEPNKIFFKHSHLQQEYNSITLPRSAIDPTSEPELLNRLPPKLTAAKFNDLLALCSGLTPVVRHKDHVSFYKNLPHQ